MEWVEQFLSDSCARLFEVLDPMATKKTAAPKSTASAKDVLAQLGALAGSAKPAAKTAQKWQLPVTPEFQVVAARWAGAKIVSDVSKARLESTKDELCEYATGVLVERLWENGSKPSNPSVTLVKADGSADHSFLYILQDRFSVQLPECQQGEEVDSAVSVFEGLGLHPDDARNLVENELDFSPIVGFRPLSELLNGTFGESREFIPASDVEQSAGMKLAALVAWDGNSPVEPLTSAEKAVVVDRSNKVAVKAGFYDRVKCYCRSVDQLKAVLKVIKPSAYPSHLKFAPADSVSEQTQRKIAAASELFQG
jgi:hypothetical protein